MKKHSKVGGREGKPAYRVPSTFRQKVFEAVKSIPKGKTLSYKNVAKKAGKSRAYRAVGNILSWNYDPKIPCHRVIKSDGSPGGYNRGAKNKIEILRKETKKQK